MNEKSCTMLRLLMNRYHKGTSESLLRGLPVDDIKKILDIPVASGALSPLLAPVHKLAQNIHYSWFISMLQNTSKEKLPLILALLPEPKSHKLREVIKDQSPPLNLTDQMKTFLSKELYHDFELFHVLPLEYLPETEITQLASFKKTQLVEFINFLGIYDLADEIPRIVDKKLLEKIHKTLTPKKLQFLKNCLHLKEKLVTQRLQLEHWDGDALKLSKLLHHRGIVRLGYAMSGEHPDLILHITHILDTGRGEKLSRYCHKEAIPGVTTVLKKQLINVINFLKKAAE